MKAAYLQVVRQVITRVALLVLAMAVCGLVHAQTQLMGIPKDA